MKTAGAHPVKHDGLWRHGFFLSRSKDRKGKIDAFKGTICNPCVNTGQQLSLVMSVFAPVETME